MRIASLNALSDPDFITERITQVFHEADHEDVDVLALQEVPDNLHAEVASIANAQGYHAHHFGRGVPGDNVGIFSRRPFDDTGVIAVQHPNSERLFLWARVSGYLLINVHLTWGAHNEPMRRREISAIEAFAVDAVAEHDAQRNTGAREFVPILVGDFNAEPDNDCVRFLRGKTAINDVGTYWTEATLGSDLQHVPTTRETNQWGIQSALSRGLDASLLYPRRIDFIFARGWRHGGRGTLRNTRLFGTSVTPDGIDVSDHFGWVTDVEE